MGRARFIAYSLLAATSFVAVVAISGAQPASSPAARGGSAVARPATLPDELPGVVSALQDQFLEKLKSTTNDERLFDEYESSLKGLMRKYPDRADPYLGLSELMEKCSNARSLKLVDEIVSTPGLPDNVYKFYQQVRIPLNLVGTRGDFSLNGLDGKKLNFAGHAGKVVLIDFWATWCGPCVAELPTLKGYYTEMHPNGLEIIGVSFDVERTKLDQFLKTNSLPWAQSHAVGPDRERIAQTLGVTGGYLPTAFLIGRDGTIRNTLNTRFKLKEKLTALLREPSPLSAGSRTDDPIRPPLQTRSDRSPAPTLPWLLHPAAA